VVWQHKRYVQPPILAEGDGPAGKYRQWARQFYRGAEQALIQTPISCIRPMCRCPLLGRFALRDNRDVDSA